MRGLVPRIHDLLAASIDVDGRDKRGHDGPSINKLIGKHSTYSECPLLCAAELPWCFVIMHSAGCEVTKVIS